MHEHNIKLSIIIPIHNEERTVKEILNKLQTLHDFAKIEIILVNDGSTDKTKSILIENTNLYDQLIDLPNNNGKGKAVIEGIKKAKNDYIIIQDADLEYDPNDIIYFLKKIDSDESDLIMGSRFIGKHRSVLNFWHMVGNKFITFIFNLINNTTFTDIYCCYCLFKKDNLDANKLKSFGWGQQAEILTYLISNTVKIYESSVGYNARRYEEGKKIRYYHVLEVIYWIIFTRLKILIK